MKWDKYTIETTTAAEDMISAMLDGLGIEGVEIENNVPLSKEEAGEMFIDFPPQLPPDQGESLVSFYLEADRDNTQLLEQVRAALEEQRSFMDIGSGRITGSQTEDIDWMNNWKQFFHAFSIGNIRISPTWEARENVEKDKILIEIDPGISFGTGKHETTRLCILQLQKYIKDSPRVLDLGCGSGILSIVALKLGASFVVGVDIDENCIRSSMDNMRVNRLDLSRADFYTGNLISDKKLGEQIGKFDLVAANILADVIIPVAPAVFACLKDGGIFITSGIIDFKETEVTEALEAAGFQILETGHDGEWVSITARKC